MLDYIIQALSVGNLLLALLGVVAGTIIGSLPGLTATMAVAILVPLTFSMAVDSALILLGAIYTGAVYGGAYSAILLNTPGTPSAIATTFDGYPMAKKGQGDLAITIACIASVAGGLVGALFLLFLSPPLAKVALAFGPAEYFWLAMFGLTLISALSQDNLFRGLIGGCLGLLLACIGSSAVSGDIRFTFSSLTLMGGIEIVSALIGLYCIPVLLELIASKKSHLQSIEKQSGFRLKEAWGLTRKGKFNILRSSVIGTLVGILPGAGGSIAGLVAYSEARRASKTPERFGKGAYEGIQATESANNATVGGGFIPTLVLGIPGTPPDAVILGALFVQGLRTGPELFSSNGSIVYTFIFGLILATILMLPVGLVLGRYAYRFIIKVPKAMLIPSIAFLSITGAYAIRNNLGDVVIMLTLGVIGWLLARYRFSASPIVLGLILGKIAEEGFVQTWTIGSATEDLFGQFFLRPISMVIIALILLGFLWPIARSLIVKKRGNDLIKADEALKYRDIPTMLVCGVMILLGLVFWYDTLSMTDSDSYAFPRTVIVLMIVFSIILIGIHLLRPKPPQGFSDNAVEDYFSSKQPILLAALFVSIWLMPYLGFLLTMTVQFTILIFIAHDSDWQGKTKFIFPLVGLVVVVLFYLLFKEVLQVPLPSATLFTTH